MTDEPFTKAEFAIIERIVGALGFVKFKNNLWTKVSRAFDYAFKTTQVEFNFTETKPDALALQYLEERVFILSDRTRERLTGNLRWELLEGMKNTESIDEIKRRLDTVFESNDVNTERIARTETLNAMAEGRQVAHESSGVANYKMWQAAMNNARTAADSKRLHGQIQKITDVFVDPKTGDTCMHNPNRPNCRCTVVYLQDLPAVVMKGGLMYAADEVEKIEIDITTLQKGEKRIWVKATSKRVGHYRKIKDVKEIKEGYSSLDKIKNIPHGKIETINGHDVKHGYKYAKGYEVDDEWMIIERFSSREKRNVFPNPETLALFVDGDIHGLRFKPPESNKKIIPIVSLSESKYQGQDMAWSEEQTNTYITKEETIGYHYSTSKINKFGMKEIAMVAEDYHRSFTPEFGYKIIIPKGTIIKEFGSSEIRVELTKEMKIYQLKSGWCKYDKIKM